RLSTGQRINSARDDAAGLAITSRLTSIVNGLRQANRNASDAISLMQVAEGAVGQVGDNFQRIRELAGQAANSTNNADDRKSLQGEVDQLMKANYDILAQTSFNGQTLLDGRFQQNFQIGAEAGQTLQLDIPPILPVGLTGQSLTQVPILQ